MPGSSLSGEKILEKIGKPPPRAARKYDDAGDLPGAIIFGRRKA